MYMISDLLSKAAVFEARCRLSFADSFRIKREALNRPSMPSFVAKINSSISNVEPPICMRYVELDDDEADDSDSFDDRSKSYSARSVSESIRGCAVLFPRVPVAMSVAKAYREMKPTS